MIIDRIKSDRAPAPVGPYSQALIANGFVFVSGQIALDPVTGLMSGESIEHQTRRVIENIKAILDSAGTGLDRVVKTTIYLTDISKFSAVNDVYAEYFAQSLPARVTIGVSRLPKDALVEIDCIAVV